MTSSQVHFLIELLPGKLLGCFRMLHGMKYQDVQADVRAMPSRERR